MLQNLFHGQNLLICLFFVAVILFILDSQLLIDHLQVVPELEDVVLHFPYGYIHALEGTVKVRYLLKRCKLLKQLRDHLPGLLADQLQVIRLLFVLVCQVIYDAELVFRPLIDLIHGKFKLLFVLIADLLHLIFQFVAQVFDLRVK